MIAISPRMITADISLSLPFPPFLSLSPSLSVSVYLSLSVCVSLSPLPSLSLSLIIIIKVRAPLVDTEGRFSSESVSLPLRCYAVALWILLCGGY